MSFDDDYKSGQKEGFVGIRWNRLNEDLIWLTKGPVNGNRIKLREKLGKLYKDSDKRAIGKYCNEIINFVRNIKKDDVVITPTRRRISIGVIKDNYRFVARSSETGICRHRRNIKWIKDIENSGLSVPLFKAIDHFGTVVDLNDYVKEIDDIIQNKKFILPEIKIGKKIRKSEVESIKERILYLDEFAVEELVANILELWLGYRCDVTGKRTYDGCLGDGGVDIQCSFRDKNSKLKKYVYLLDAQVKRVKNNISEKTIKDFKGTLLDNRIGLFVTTSDFTREATDFAKKNDIHLINGDSLVKLVIKFYEKLDGNFKEVIKINKR